MDTFWTWVIVTLFILCMTLTPLVVYLMAWRGMQRILGETYTFTNFVEEIETFRREHPESHPYFWFNHPM